MQTPRTITKEEYQAAIGIIKAYRAQLVAELQEVDAALSPLTTERKLQYSDILKGVRHCLPLSFIPSL